MLRKKEFECFDSRFSKKRLQRPLVLLSRSILCQSFLRWDFFKGWDPLLATLCVMLFKYLFLWNLISSLARIYSREMLISLLKHLLRLLVSQERNEIIRISLSSCTFRFENGCNISSQWLPSHSFSFILLGSAIYRNDVLSWFETNLICTLNCSFFTLPHSWVLFVMKLICWVSFYSDHSSSSFKNLHCVFTLRNILFPRSRRLHSYTRFHRNCTHFLYQLFFVFFFLVECEPKALIINLQCSFFFTSPKI